MWRLALLVFAGCGRIEFDRIGDGGTSGEGATVTCPNTYTRTPRGGCYRVEDSDQLPWLAAEAQCEQEGGHLVTISSAQELADVDDIVPASLADTFIGGSDRITEGTYLNVDGTPAYLDWDSGEPDGLDGSDCLEIRDDGFVADTSCDNVEDFVCEIDGVTVDPTSF